MAKEVQFELNTVTSKFEKNMGSALKTARQFDVTMAKLHKTTEIVEKTLKRINGDVDVNVSVDAGALDRAETKVDAIDGATPKVTVQADSSALDAVSSDVTAIDGATPKITVQADASALDEVDSDVQAIDGKTPKVTVRAEEDGLSDIKRQLDNIQTLGVISVAIQVGGIAKDAFDSVPVVSSIQDQQEAMRILEAAQVDVAAGASAVSTVWTNNWGQSKAEIADVVKQLQLLKVPDDQLADAAMSVFELTANGRDLNEVLTAQSILVTSGVSDSYRDAANLLASGFTGAAGTSEDFLDTIREYAPQLRELKLSAEGFLNYLNSGVQEGAWNTDKLADALKEANVRVQEAVTDPATPYAQALQRVDQMDEAQAYVDGEITGEQFFAGVIAAVQEKGTNFDLFEIFGSGAEDLGAAVLGNVDFSGVQISEDAASNWSSTLRDTAANDWSSLTRTLGDGFLGQLDVMTGGLDTWIADARLKMTTFNDELQSGTAVPEALEISLAIPGLADTIRDFEAGLGNFVIDLQLALAGVLEFLGRGEEAAGIRTAVEGQAANQFEYELKFSDNDDEIATAIQRAIDRGVSPEALSESVAQVTDELVSEGMTIRAEQIVAHVRDMAQKAVVELVPTGVYSSWGPLPESVTVDVDPNLTQEAKDRLAKELALASEEAAEIEATTIGLLGSATTAGITYLPTIDVSTAEETLRRARNALNQFIGPLEDTGSGGSAVAGLGLLDIQFDEVATAAQDSIAKTDAAGQSVKKVGLNADTTQASLRGLGDASATGLGALAAAHAQFMPPAIEWWEDYEEAAWAGIAAAGGVVPNIEYAPPGANGGSGQGRAKGGDVFAGEVYTVGEQGPELFAPGMDGAIIPHELSRALMSIPSMIGAGAGGISTSYTTVNASININSQGTAQLMGGASRVARALRRGN